MTTNASLQARREAAVVRGVSTMLPVFADKAQGAEIWDVEGKRYIDFAGGIAVVNTGHNHPKVKAAVIKQVEQFSHVCFQVTPYEPYVELAEKLNALLPGDEPKQTLFLTTGAEAVENAVKIARSYTKRPGIIAFAGGFHGRTLMASALTGKVAPYKIGFGPFPGEVYHAPYPNTVHGVSVEDSLKAIETLFKADIEPTRVAAFILELVQGEGGFNIAPPEWVKALRAIADKHGILLIIDEVQTGFARTGRMLAVNHYDIVPDLVTVAKSLAGGYPLSGVIGRKAVMDAVAPGGLGGTYGGSPIGCAAALAVLDVIAEENLVERSNSIGTRITGRLKAFSERNSGAAIGDVRGLGGMVAMELVKDRSTNEPDPDLTKKLVQESAKRGLVILSCGTYANVIRFLVPLVASDAIIDEGLDILEGVLTDLSG